MTTDPRPDARSDGAAPPDPALRPRPGSGVVARLLTVAIALVVTPIATGLLAYGGFGWRMFFMNYGHMSVSPTELLTSPMGMRVLLGVGLGVLLLMGVVATGIASSAGLVAVGALSLVSLTVTAVPGLLNQVYANVPDMLPNEVLDGLVLGLPSLLHPLLGGLGVALALARRRPDAHVALSITGAALVPVLLLLGAGLHLYGLAEGAFVAAVTFDSRFNPLTAVLVLAGALLVLLGAASTRWSPYSLVVPALAMLAVTLMVIVPGALSAVPLLWTNRTGSAVISFAITGGALAAAMIMLTHTGVLALVRGRARRRVRALPSSVPASAPAPAPAPAPASTPTSASTSAPTSAPPPAQGPGAT